MNNKIINSALSTNIINWVKKIYRKTSFLNISEADKKFIEVFWIFSDIMKRFNMILLFPIHMKSYTDTKEINLKMYSEYHIEFCCINIIWIFDRILRFINLIYWLKLKENNWLFKNILSHSMLSTELKDSLKKLDDNIKILRKQQNNFKHKSWLYIDDLIWYDLHDFLWENFINRDEIEKKGQNFTNETIMKYNTYIECLEGNILNILNIINNEIYDYK